MVRLARSWKTVPPQRTCELVAPRPQRPVPPRSSVTLQLDVNACPGVNYLEHVQAKVSLSAARRGDLKITLTSPAGTEVTLLAPRAHDSSRAGFTSWPFMSVHMWGENPIGIWQLEVSNEGRYMAGPLSQWELIFYGTETPAQEDDVSLDAQKSSTWNVRDPDTVEEVRQNDIDFPPPWHDTHTIREEAAAGARADDADALRSGCAARAPPPAHRCLGLCLLLLILISAADASRLDRGRLAGRQPPKIRKRDCALTASIRLDLQISRPPRAPCLLRASSTPVMVT